VIGLIAPVLQLKWQSETPWYMRLKQVVAIKMDSFVLGKQGITRPLILLLSLVLIALLWIPVTYHISAPARLEGAIQQALVAPDHGYLEQAMVRPGDSVKKNQVLATLANQELLLEKRRWQTELEQYENAYSTSLAQSNRVDLVVNQSKAEEARVQLALIEQKLQHTQVLAPFDGVIIKGDLKDSVGAPLQRGDTLLTIAPTAAFRLMIEVDERDISHVLTGQQGQLALVSLPNQRIQFTVARIVPVAIVKDGRNMFEVEGTLQAKQLALLKPGLEGIAKIEVGQRHFIWLLSHRMIDWFKLNLWSWGL
jgi:multidrug resistance efflux pump